MPLIATGPRAAAPVPALESRWHAVMGWPMHARVADGLAPPGAPAVVLVHGLVVSSRYMVPTALRLAPHFRVYAPDLPGFGKSAAPARVLRIPELADALVAWMDASGVTGATLVGNSLGCQVAVHAAVRHPERVQGLVLAGPTIDPRGRSALEQARRLLADALHETPSSFLVLLRDVLDTSVRRGIGTFFAGLEDRIEEHLPRVTAPALVVRGSRDPIAPESWAATAARLLPAGRLVVLPGAPHAVNYSAPEAFAAVVRDFVAGGPHRQGEVAAGGSHRQGLGPPG